VSLLEIDGVDAGYGALQALFGVSLAVEEGEAFAVIGANGAGKSTLMKVLAGLVPARAGEVRYAGRSLAGVPAHRRVMLGMSLVPEGRRIFPSLSVEENLDVGRYRRREGPWSKETVLAALPLLARVASRSAARLSGGEQQALAIGRALMANPRLLLLDEVSLGLAPIVVQQLYEALPRLRAEGTTVVVVEQDVNRALAATDRFCCLLEGRISLAGRSPGADREEITAAYFGLGTVAGRGR
jgi:branched-chain amino acid transport system ATP-binding protein